MRKDIEFPKVTDIYIVAVKEWDKDFLAQNWNIYLINNSNSSMEVVIVVSRGYDTDRKTATLRHALGNIAPKTSVKVEFITEEVLGFTNEFLLTYFIGDTLYDKKFVFLPHTISDTNETQIPLMDTMGVKAI